MDEKFTKIITDFTNDLLLTFPELKANIDKINSDLQKTYDHCIEMYPKIFFEILYENNSLFEKECFLLPEIDFTSIMKDNDKIIGISEKTKKTIWKYLQLILFSVLEKINTNKSFGETSKIFEGIEENELHKKIAETIKEMVGYGGNLIWDTTKPNGMMKKVLDVSKLNSLGWQSKTNLNDGIKSVF